MKALVPALSLIAGMACAPALAQDSGSTVNTDDICAVRPDLCGNKALRHKNRKKKPARELDFADFNKPAKPARAAASRGPASDTAAGPLREEDFVPPKKKIKKKSNEDQTGDFWEREEEDAKVVKEVPLLDIERQQAVRTAKPKPVMAKPQPRYQISFDDYLNENSRTLAGRMTGRQDAFQLPVRQAILSTPVPGTGPISVGGPPADEGGAAAGNGQSVREPAPPAPPPANPPPQP